MELAIDVFLAFLAAYAIAGLLFGIYIVFIGATKLDPSLAESKKGIRVLILPGIIATWPFLLRKLVAPKTKNS